MLKKRIAKACFFSFLFLVSIISCEIGLGGAVDTQPPSIIIDSPKVDAVIRDVFAITGTWTDDGSITSVEAELKRTDGKGTPIRLEGTFETDKDKREKGTWKVLVDYQANNIIDGTYQATVYAKDNGKHETSQSTTFTIDNTAPVLVVSRPSIKAGQMGFDSYGRSFTLEGKASDDNDVSLIEVKVFENESATEPLKIVELSSVPLTIEQDVAIYAADKANDYALIYGHTDENGIILPNSKDTEQRYCTFVIYDGAERYPIDGSEQTEADKKGNSTEVYYMNSEISTLLQGGYKITDLYHIKNGTYGTDAGRTAAAENVLSFLESHEVTKSKFSINPANNPRFIVSSGSVLEAGKDLNHVDYQLTAGNRYIEVEITPGLDGYAIDPDSVGVYLLRCDENGEEISDEKIWLINKGAEYHKAQEEAEGQTFASGYGIYSVSGSTYKFKTSKVIHKNNYSVNTGVYYLVVVDGCDAQGVESGSIISDGKYGFKLVSNEEKIELKGKGVPEYISQDSAAWKGFHEKFNAELSWTGGEAPYYIYRNGVSTPITVENQTVINGESKWFASEEFTYSKLQTLGFPDSISYKMEKNGDVVSTTATIDLKYDSVKPDISNIIFKDAYYDEKTSTYFVNNSLGSKFDLSGIATDDTGIESVVLNVPGLSPKTVENESRFKFEEIEFKGSDNNPLTGTVNAVITATDLAGNQNTYTLKISFDTTPPSSLDIIDSSAKNLTIRLGQANNNDIDSTNPLWDTSLDTNVGGKYGNGTFGNTTTIQLRGNIADNTGGSGLSKIYYKVFPDEHLLSGSEDERNEYLNNLVESIKAEPTGYIIPLDNSEEKRVFYNVSRKLDQNGDPVEPAEPDPEELTRIKNQFIAAGLSDGTKLSDDLNTKGYFKYYNTVPSTFKDTIRGLSEGNNYLIFVAEDNVGNSAVIKTTVNFEGTPTDFINYSINIDITPPSDITTKTSSGIIYTNGNDMPLLWGTVSDKSDSAASAGMASFVLTRDGVDTTIKAALREVKNTDPQDIQDLAEIDPTLRIWEADVTSLLPNDSRTVSITATATDAAGEGNSTPAVVATITIDLDGPTVIIDSNSPSDANTEEDGIQVNGKINLSGTATDPNGVGAITGIYYYACENGEATPSKPQSSTDISENGWKEVEGISLPGNAANWEISGIDTTLLKAADNSLITEGTKVCFTVAAKDKAGNTGYSDLKTVFVKQDTDRPIIKMNQVKSDGSGYLTSKTVFGSVKDDDGTINKLWVWSKKLNQNVEPTAVPTTSDNGQTWTLPEVPEGSAGWIEFGKVGTDSTLDNNNWQIESEETDGLTTWFWALADANNTVFWTKDTSAFKQPYITYSDVTKQSNTNGVSFEYDTESPEINSVELLRLPTNTYKNAGTQTRYAANEIADYVSNLNLEWDSANNIVFGKNYALMYAKVIVTEKTGMHQEKPIALDYYQNLSAVEISSSGPDNNQYIYYLGPFDLSEKPTAASLTLKFTTRDVANKPATKEKIITVDNDANITISNISPSKDEITSGKFTYRGQVSDAESNVIKVEYYIPKYSENTALAAAANDTDRKTLLDGKDFIHITSATSIQWSIDFNNFNADILNYATNGTEVTVDSNFAGYNIGENIYQIPVWFKVTDSVGNVGYITDNEITYDPNEDRPKVYITDPEMSNGAPVEKGGRIKISGTAQDNEGIEAVYLQFKVGTGDWTDSSAAGAVQIPGTDLYGFVAKNTKNWNYTYDVSDKNIFHDETIVQVRAIAEDNDTNLLSAWSDILKIKVNNTIPYLDGDMYLRQYDSNGTTLLVEKKYEPNIYIKGDWILEGRFTTPSSNFLSGMTINVNNGESKTTTWERTDTHQGEISGENEANVTISFANNNDDRSLDFKIPITGSTTCKVTIEATDDSNHLGSETPEINIDNTAPSFADYTDKPNNKIVLYQDSYGAGGTQIGPDHFIQNSNGAQFTLAGKIVEEQSGFDKAVIYFMRTGSDGVERVYNPMEVHGTDNLNNRTNIATNKNSTSEEKPIYINDDKLPVRALTVTRSTTETAQNDEIKTNKNIRVGGLVYIGGLYRLITEVNRVTGTITFEPEAPTANTSAEFVYALVVDHNGERDNGSGGVDFDDGDGLLESYSGSTTANFRWEATFNSANIPDGPIEVYVITFDKAGNIGWGSLTTKASNNAPRITKVLFGTDLNGNGVYDYGTDEFSTFYAFKDDYGYGNTKKGNAVWTLNTSVENGNYWTVKNGMAVIPEFVGGAGPFYYVFEKGVPAQGEELSNYIKTAPKTFVYSNNQANNPVLLDSGANNLIKAGGAAGTDATWTYGTSTSGSNTGGSLTLNNSALVTTTGEYAKAGDGTETNPAVVYTFSFWDSTEESTPGLDTGSTILNAYIRQDLTDDVIPNSVIKPFEWNGTGYTKSTVSVVNGITQTPVGQTLDTLGVDDVLGSVTTTETTDGITTETTITITPNNSLYGASTANGHIELEEDLPDSLKTKTAGNPATAFGADPKVSGKITIHGTSYDNTRLSSIWFKFEGFAAANGKAGGDSGKTGTSGYTQAAYYNSSTATWEPAPATMAADGWECRVTDNYFNQSGHKIDWYLSIDTSRISTVTGLDKKFTVISLDSSSKVSVTTESAESVLSTDDTAYNKPVYQVDVVPYIARIYTSLAKLKSNNWSVYNRTALGHYPVAADETIYLYGFNLGNSTYKPKYGVTELAAPVNGSVTNLGTTDDPIATVYYSGAAYASYDVVTFPVSNMTTSGSLNLTVNSVPNLNNYNNSEAKGSYKGITTSSTGDKAVYDNYYNRQPNGDNNNLLTDDVELDVWEIDPQAVKPKKGTISQPVMAINPVNHDIGFAFVNGALSFSMPGKGHSYDYWIGGIDYWTSIGLAYDSLGNSYATTAGGDINASVADQFRIFTSRWGRGRLHRDGYNDGRNQLRLEMIAQADFEKTSENSNTYYAYGNYNKERIRSPSIATTNASANSTRVYIAYYDEINDEIRFKWGNFGATKDETWKTSWNADTRAATFFGDYYGKDHDNGQDKSEAGGKDIVNDANHTASAYSIYHLNHNSLLAGHTENKVYKTNGTTANTAVITTDGKPVYAGKYVSIAAIEKGQNDTDDAVVAVWWDGTNNQLLYSFNKNPSSITAGTYKQADTGWSSPVAIFGKENGIGEYCKITVDKNKGVHIAAYDGLNGDLWYAYIPQFDNTENIGKCIIDSYGIIGTEINIDVVQDNNNKPVPYISYYAGSCAKPKMAYWVGKEALSTTVLNKKEGSGAFEDAFTKAWEVTVLPTTSKVSIDYINIGTWKDANGKLTYSTTDGNEPGASNIGKNSFQPGANSDVESYGMVYGNGTKNPVLGYAITQGASGYIETAQKK
ncbi:MAG: hypothetical protein IK024_00720 [Treponema sp.]|nr:hypothetical protein [Treponema sp.]